MYLSKECWHSHGSLDSFLFVFMVDAVLTNDFHAVETLMPIYEYACRACGHTFEEWQKMSDPPVGTCPKCKKRKVEKLISQTAFLLKGGGWYKDLYSSSKPGAEAKDDGGGSSGKDVGGTSEAGTKKSASERASNDGKNDNKSDSKKETKGADAKDTAKSSDKASNKDTKHKDSPKKSETRAA